ncbi:MAG: hypothetical protein P8P30_04515 [Rickettsiales bacterium]|nr:hypothetical protein [Rickettsiales bacterium]
MTDGFVAGMLKESFPVVGNIMELKDTVADFREKGVVNSGIRAGLNCVPNGPLTLWAEGLTRATNGKGWEETIADAIAGDGSKKQSDAKEVELSIDERENVLEMATETARYMEVPSEMADAINTSLKKIDKIKNPEKQAATRDAYFTLIELQVKMEIGEDGKVTSKEAQMAAAVGEELKKAGYAPVPENTEAGLQRNGGGVKGKGA